MPIDSTDFAKQMVATSNTAGKELAEAVVRGTLEGPALVQTLKQLMWGEFYFGVLPPVRQLDVLYRDGGIASEPDLILGLSDQIRDEVKHSKLFSRRLEELGADPNILAYEPSEVQEEVFQAMMEPESITAIAGALQATGEPLLANLMTTMQEKDAVDDRTQQYLHKAEIDEGNHINFGKKILARFATDDESQRAAEAAGNAVYRGIRKMYRLDGGSPIHEQTQQIPSVDG